ncbi:hypothetical protein [Alteriqipengyuania lutimaris]|uniref:Uncharacterized protein n=1 Tax=Alteriqipengyuania lutimaris TaxID=1538146 RepID=A0A395LMG0_9SPHN|nr:hypothetical protein [Alteriqipengyuania lutimaris]MBB3032703.1 hypothetical protein [Alteriqipengyuania lutimaris]RDS78188.1 hypothetical protein DL238_11620 [Alteriqipengyuania lutimaris]
MSFWSAIVLIVLIGAAASILRARYNAQAGITEDMMGNQTITHRPDPEPRADPEAEREIAALKERIAVLERIAYDKNSATAQERARISAEIDALREEQD